MDVSGLAPGCFPSSTEDRRFQFHKADQFLDDHFNLRPEVSRFLPAHVYWRCGGQARQDVSQRVRCEAPPLANRSGAGPSWREWRKVSQSLTLQYAKVMYLIEDRPEHRRLIHRYIEVAEYLDGRVELWAEGASCPTPLMTGSAKSTRLRSSRTSGWGTCWRSPHRCRRCVTAGIRRSRRARSWASRRARPRCP